MTVIYQDNKDNRKIMYEDTSQLLQLIDIARRKLDESICVLKSEREEGVFAYYMDSTREHVMVYKIKKPLTFAPATEDRKILSDISEGHEMISLRELLKRESEDMVLKAYKSILDYKRPVNKL